MGSGHGRGGHLCSQCQKKPQGRLCLLQWHEQTHLGRVSLITCSPPLHQMLPPVPWVSSQELLFSLWHISPVAHIPEGSGGLFLGGGAAPALSRGPQQWQEDDGVGHS